MNRNFKRNAGNTLKFPSAHGKNSAKPSGGEQCFHIAIDVAPVVIREKIFFKVGYGN